MPVRVSGLARSKVIPDRMLGALVKLREELVPPLVADFIANEPPGGNWPKGRRRTIQEQTRGVVRGEAVIIGTFGSRYARSLDTGLTVQPRRKKVIRFRGKDGNFVFTSKPVTHAPRPYFGRVLSQVPRIVEGVYDRVMSEVGR